MEKLKIMTYNLLEGGIDSKGYRIPQIIEVINGVKPDFLAVQEANRFDDDGYLLLEMLSSETDLPYYALSEGALYGEKRYHVASLSRYPFQEEYQFPDFEFQSAALSVVINSPFGRLSLCNVHLHSSSEEERLREISAVLDYLSRYDQRIILGDFNALSLLDKDQYEYGDLSDPEFIHYGMTSYATTDMLMRKKYVDVVAYLDVDDRSTHPTSGVPHPISKELVRTDYIFVPHLLFENIELFAEVIKTPISHIASDHYPVVLYLVDHT